MGRPVDADAFASSVEGILGRVAGGVEDRLPEAVHDGVKAGARAWRRNIREKFPDGQTYVKGGKTYETGRYARSIRSHMTSKSGSRPAGEAGAPRMPGLPHLLEFGHARVGGGRVPGREHVAPAAEVAFDAAVDAAERAVEEAMRDA